MGAAAGPGRPGAGVAATRHPRLAEAAPKICWSGCLGPVDPTRAGSLPEAVTAAPDVLDAWLQGLTLMRERFLAVLAGEGALRLAAALHTPLIHICTLPSRQRSGTMSPHTVIRVLRQGYRQHQRVLRHAEVVVARAAAGQQPVTTEPQEAHDE